MANEREIMRVLFVCMGNICRSPAGEGILKSLIDRDPSMAVYVESCGIGNWHVGQPPDKHIQQASLSRGIRLTSKAQQFKIEFLDQFDYILVADNEILKYLYQYAKIPEQKAKILLMTEFSSAYKRQEVPDPYCQGKGAFELVLDILEDSCQGLLEHIRSRQRG